MKRSITVSLGAISWIRILLSRWENSRLYLILKLDTSLPTNPAISTPRQTSFKFIWVSLEYRLMFCRTLRGAPRCWQVVYHLHMESGNIGWWICNRFKRESSERGNHLDPFLRASLTYYLDLGPVSGMERARCSIRNISSSIRISFDHDHHLPYHRRCSKQFRWYTAAVSVRSPPWHIFTGVNMYICRKTKHGSLVALVSYVMHMKIGMNSD